jgi:site-specific recombinase XerD
MVLNIINHFKQAKIQTTIYSFVYIALIFNGKEHDFILTWGNGKYVHPNYYTLKFNRLIKKVGIKKRVIFHDLRHTNATLLLKQGIDFKVIQSRLGHSDINTTLNIYSHVTTDMQKNATEKLTSLLDYSK